MQEVKTLFKRVPESFTKRFWKLFAPYLLFYSVFLVLSFFFWKSLEGVFLLWLLVISLSIIVMLLSSYKWSVDKVSLITFYAEVFTFEIAHMDKKNTFSIQKDNLATTLKWKGGRPRVLVLTIFDGKNRVAQLYSGGRKRHEIELEEIAFALNQRPTTNDQ
jgi:hypothetical protein